MDTGIDLLNSVFSSAAEGIVISNDKGMITMANPKSEEMFGYGQGEMIGLTIEDLIPINFKKDHSKLRDSYINHPSPRPMGIGRDLQGLRKDGGVFPLEIGLSFFKQGDAKYVAAFVTDITERKKIEERLADYTNQLEQKVRERTQELEHLNLGLLRENKERIAIEERLRQSQFMYELIAKNFPKGLISILDSNFCYLFCDGKELNIQTKPEIGDHFLLKFPLDIRDVVEKQLSNASMGITSSWEYQNEGNNYVMHFVPIEDTKDKVDKILVVEEDITELKKAEIEIRANLEREKELNVMKSRFVSLASHEFRTPLSTVLSSINLISKYTTTEDQPKRDKHIQRITTAVKNLTDILNDFLSLERLESGAISSEIIELSFADLVNEIEEQMSALLKQDQKLLIKRDFNGDIIKSDPKLLKNIVINLVSNAIKYSDEGKEITLDFKLEDQWIFVKVIDQGIGIPKEEQKNLFQRFFRAENAVNIQGTGLGLHIVKKYVDLLDGSLDLKSEQNEGTTITVNIPHE
jgi:PAS domain S-box-containing protein